MELQEVTIMFGFPFITSLVIAIALVTLTSLAINKGLKKKEQD